MKKDKHVRRIRLTQHDNNVQKKAVLDKDRWHKKVEESKSHLERAKEVSKATISRLKEECRKEMKAGEENLERHLPGLQQLEKSTTPA